MGFQKTFEKHVNDDMSDSPSSSKSPLQIDTESASKGLKKRHSIATPALEADDMDNDNKYDRPPRFSTIFGPATLPPRNNERLSLAAQRRSGGVFVPTSVFILLIGLIIFEGLALFAYTVIGLYNNLPMRMIHPANEICSCNDRAAVNISPNFFMGNSVPSSASQSIASAAMMVTSTLASSTTTDVTSTISPSVGPVTLSSTAAAALVSNVLKSFAGIDSDQNPSQATVYSTATVIVNESGSPLPPESTFTSIAVVVASPVVVISTLARKRSIDWTEAESSARVTPSPAFPTHNA